MITDGQTVYLKDENTQTPSLPNIPIQLIPPGTCFTNPLYGILPRYGPNMRLESRHLLFHNNHRKHSTSES